MAYLLVVHGVSDVDASPERDLRARGREMIASREDGNDYNGGHDECTQKVILVRCRYDLQNFTAGQHGIAT